ncbi:C-type lectin domain family 6 member A-like [Cololabis saira]|uniref:C-type lectin domain family 6 member A-like n=1 Tax=Cololabis saira TaxID=129043 RepID=UPI002AD36E7C|nr:C-type lectin domain family 6 member A-like [Cololabis saira]
MSTEIQTAPDLRVKFSRRVHEYGRDQDQCEIQMLDEENPYSVPDLQQTEKNNQKNLPVVKRNSFRVFNVFLGVFNLLVLVGVIIRCIPLDNNQLQREHDQLNTSYSQLQVKYNQLNNTYNQLKNELDGIPLDNNQLQREHDQVNTNYSQLQVKHNQLINTHNQLKNELDGECPDGWRRFGSSFYKKFTESKTWSESRRECEKRGADLVIISSKKEQDFVGRLYTNETSWIGLKAEWSTKKEELDWKWVDGSPLKILFWAAEWSQHQYNQSEYAALCCTNEGKWTYSYHADENNWICEKRNQAFIVES